MQENDSAPVDGREKNALRQINRGFLGREGTPCFIGIGIGITIAIAVAIIRGGAKSRDSIIRSHKKINCFRRRPDGPEVTRGLKRSGFK